MHHSCYTICVNFVIPFVPISLYHLYPHRWILHECDIKDFSTDAIKLQHYLKHGVCAGVP